MPPKMMPKNSTLQPKEKLLYHPEAPLVRILGLGPHKTPHISPTLPDEEKIPKAKLPRQHGTTDYGVWTTFAFIIGLSLTSFFFNIGSDLVTKVRPSLSSTFHPNAQVLTAVDVATTSEEKLGSDDVEDSISMELSDETVYSLKSTGKYPILSASAYLVGDVENGKIILQSHSTTTYPFASVTKLMTALVAKQVDNLHDIATVSKEAVATYGKEGDLHFGEKIVAGDLIYPMLLESSNDAAEALANHYGRQQFINLMNQKAAAIGMFSTTYFDASGLSYKNFGSAEDLFKLASHIHTIMPEILDATRVKEYDILNHHWTNHNHFLVLSSFAGGKNGFTDEAKHTSVALFTLPLTSKDGKVTELRTLAIIILHSDNREKDVATLLSYIKKNVYLDQKEKQN